MEEVELNVPVEGLKVNGEAASGQGRVEEGTQRGKQERAGGWGAGRCLQGSLSAGWRGTGRTRGWRQRGALEAGRTGSTVSSTERREDAAKCHTAQALLDTWNATALRRSPRNRDGDGERP